MFDDTLTSAFRFRILGQNRLQLIHNVRQLRRQILGLKGIGRVVIQFVLDVRLRRGTVLDAPPRSFARGFAYGSAATAVLVATATASSPFIYFQF